jgi:UDP-N-acetylglucosamine 2-epimerase (non-hydrolysing)
MLEVLLIAGTRPNFVKIGPLVRAFAAHTEFHPVLVHTGQHYDASMSDVFFEQLKLPRPDIFLSTGSGSHAVQTARIMQELEPVVKERSPAVVLVVGDVNSTLAAALTATKLHVPLAHVEAGLRSFDRRMPEEINRIATDAITDYLFVTEAAGTENLLSEGHSVETICFAGNVMIDSLRAFEGEARRKNMSLEYGLERGSYVLVTAHRPELVDHPDLLSRFVEGLEAVSSRHGVIFPIHPRTRARIESAGLLQRLDSLENVFLVDPLGYLEFTSLIADAGLVLTDSGGIQEETTAFSVPCATIRDNTERPCTVSAGTNVLLRLDPGLIADAADRALGGDWKKGRIPDLWDGHAAGRVAEGLYEMMSR